MKPNDQDIDKSKVPAELTIFQRAVEVKDLLALKDTDEITFSYGDYIPGAHAFNQYLEANIQPGTARTFTRNKAIQMIKQLALTINSGGLSSLPMLCFNDMCPRAADCPIRMIGDTPPVGEQCPIEKLEALNHVRSLSRDFGEGRSYADQLQIQGVAALQMLKSRVLADMAINPNPLMEIEKGTDARGNIVRDTVENPNFKILANLAKQEQILLKSLHLTQEQRIKMGSIQAKTSDVLVGSLKQKLQELMRNNKTEGLDIVDAQVKDTDDTDKEVHNRTNGPGHTSNEGQVLGSNNANAGDLSESIGNIQSEKADYRSAKRTGTGSSNQQYSGQSPFIRRSTEQQNSNPRSNASDMEDAF